MPAITKGLKDCRWYEEISAYLGLSQELVEMVGCRIKEESNLAKAAEKYGGQDVFLARRSAAKQAIQEQFPRIGTIEITDLAEDEIKSASWSDNIIVAIRQERTGYELIHIFDQIIKGVIIQKLKSKRKLRVLDYGCGTSLFGRYLAEIFNEKLEIILSDIDGYHFRFARERLRKFTSNCTFFPIRNVRKTDFDFGPLDLIYCYTVFEHLPNVLGVMNNFINHLDSGGVLIETYTGQSGEKPHKSDTVNAYQNRDRNLDFLRDNLELLYGKMPDRTAGSRYANDESVRYWIRPPYDAAEYVLMQRKLEGNIVYRCARRLYKKITVS